ncbi:MAG: 50S ribosomal protein L29 [Ignavibacteriales bacterium]|nr:MAG: 50S ribosomal protein L29 [Ignavibacteriales bacterium]
MKIYEIKEMKSDELRKRIEEEEKNLIDLRFAHELKQLTNTSKLGLVKKDISRMKTILREREIAEKKSAVKDTEGAKS